MNSGRTVFSQIMDHLPKHRLHALVEQFRGNYKVTRFSCLDQFYCMVFAQLTYREVTVHGKLLFPHQETLRMRSIQLVWKKMRGGQATTN